MASLSSTSKQNVSSLLVGAAIGSAVSLGATYMYEAYRRKAGEGGEKEKIGPPAADIRYPLKLVGNVDRLYDDGGPKPFCFNKEVVEVFDDMVSRSVPLYSEAIDFLLYVVARYYKPGTNVYDLGCSTGTTLDSIARSIPKEEYKLNLVGIDEAVHMIAECRRKLKWAERHHTVDIRLGNICTAPVENSSVCILNYTLQFVKWAGRDPLLQKIYDGLCQDGILFISEKVASSDDDMQGTCVWAYEDFKHRRGYSKEYIARKKAALTNVLVPYTEKQLCDALYVAGFDHVQTCVKWNCFVSIIARKRGVPAVRQVVQTPTFDSFYEANPLYLKSLSEGAAKNFDALCHERRKQFYGKGKLSARTLREYEGIAEKILTVGKCIQTTGSKPAVDLIVDSGTIRIGDEGDLTEEGRRVWEECAVALKPWRKGPWKIFGVDIDAEWRSDMKWERILPRAPSLKGKVVCDLGCGNGYFMYRMLDQKPKCVVGLDPNFHAWLEFQMFQHFTQDQARETLKFEMLRGENMDLFPKTFDVVFCLGVLYHTPDPVGMLRKIRDSLTRKGVIVVDCEGIPGEDHVALFPKKKYTNMKGVYFLPTEPTLVHWLRRSGFNDINVFYSEPLSPAEQRVTEWAPIRGSLEESFDKNFESLTIEGYPRPLRMYLRATRGGSA
jgi:tRNA (mo5U34)-methyltransferase